MNGNVKSFSATCSKIGLALLLFYSFFTLSTFGVSLFNEFYKLTASELKAEIVFNLLLALTYFLSFSVPAFILRKMCKNLPNSRPIYTSFKLNRWVIFIIFAVVAVNFTLSYLNNSVVKMFLPDVPEGTASAVAMVGETSSFSSLHIFFLLEILSTAIVPAFCEEYLFRGAILTNLLPFGKSTAIFASAFLFGLMHQNPMQMLYTMLMGVVIGYIYVKTKSIWVCIILHGINNFITVLEQYLPMITDLVWVTVLIDFVVILCGVAAVLVLLLRKNREPIPEEAGSFGRVYESGMDYEELKLELPTGKKLRKFFSPTVIIFVVICIFNITRSLLTVYGVSFL